MVIVGSSLNILVLLLVCVTGLWRLQGSQMAQICIKTDYSCFQLSENYLKYCIITGGTYTSFKDTFYKVTARLYFSNAEGLYLI